MIHEDDITGLILTLAKARGWKVTHASRMASGSGDTVARLQGGMGLTLRRAQAIIQRCSDLWPEAADPSWPAGIPRPEQALAERTRAAS